MQDEADRRARGVTRRSLIRGAGLAAAGGALLHPLEALAEEAAKANGHVRTQGPDAVHFSLKLNGRRVEVQAEPRETLLEMLRRPPLLLTGAKPVCERAQCGACTVWLDGRIVPACTVLAVETEGREVTTIEGLGTPEKPHPVQQAFVQEDAVQCGFCTPGMVMVVAKAVEEHGASLTPEQARQATAGTLCRCGTHPHVVKAALRAAKEA